MNRSQLLRNFSLNLPADYHSEGVERCAGLNRSTLRRAGVMVGCVEREHGLNVILIHRAEHLKHHPGQVAFPGGKYEDSDRSIISTAIRETEEEIGIPGKQIRVLGTLPELITVSRFLVTPVIALVSPDYRPRPDKNEVASVFEVPASYLFDIQQLYSQIFRLGSVNHRVFAIPYEEHFIWGVTAQIIQALQIQLKD
jgi:8-oxo-dGTP pyrophosphatase MutT (NUDIX family)